MNRYGTFNIHYEIYKYVISLCRENMSDRTTIKTTAGTD